MMKPKMGYRAFKKWVDDQVTTAEAMSLEENQQILPELLEKNSQAWVQVQEMLEAHTLHYQSKGKKKRHTRASKRPDMVAVMVRLSKLDGIAGTFESLQEEVKAKYKAVFAETWLEMVTVTDELISHCLDCLTSKESHEIDVIQAKDQEEEEETEHG